MDKIEKIRAEIERRYTYQKEMYSKTIPDGRPNDGWAESLAIMGDLEELRDFIDTLDLEEEPVLKGFDEAYLNEKIAKASKTWEGVDVDKYMDEVRGRESDKSLEEAAEKYARKSYPYEGGTKGLICETLIPTFKDGFIAGAEWKEEQFEKNRLAHCDAVSKEDCDRETDFAMEIIEKEHRQPTFIDAINYGMRLQKEQMLKDAVEGYVNYYEDSGGILMAEAQVGCPYHNGDKVKLIVVKED